MLTVWNISNFTCSTIKNVYLSIILKVIKFFAFSSFSVFSFFFILQRVKSSSNYFNEFLKNCVKPSTFQSATTHLKQLRYASTIFRPVCEYLVLNASRSFRSYSPVSPFWLSAGPRLSVTLFVRFEFCWQWNGTQGRFNSLNLLFT